MSEYFTTHMTAKSLSVYGRTIYFSKPSETAMKQWFAHVEKEFGERFELSGPFCRAETRDTGFAHHYTLYAQGKRK